MDECPETCPMRGYEHRAEVRDLNAGRCYVILGDGETWDTVEDCTVRFATAEQEDLHQWGDPIDGYRDISIEDLVRHYLATKR